ncbi:MAG: farnesyltranstransferase [Micavibrio sp.]|nr:farnesyltranstransferase [Micavibrio sp.]|tara:strand:+ start:1700 stop:2680 length:981 start_codon:yes stop_codon:yes gene_type:complete
MKNPVEEISLLLQTDMDAVNTIILQRMDSHVPLVNQLAGYLIAAGGKRIRPLLTLASTAIHNGDMSRAHLLAACVEFIHTATLLHDDVVDESDERRGQATANEVFGNQASVLVGDFLFSRSFQMMVDDGNLDILRILSDASAIIAQGEVLQLSSANNIETSMDDYMAIIKAKTAALFAAACEVGPVIAGGHTGQAEAMAEYGLNLGIAFQIVDDVLDYSANQKKLGKTVGDDFREGKITAPVLYALEKADAEEQEFWTRVINANQKNDDDLDHAIALMRKHKALEQSMGLAQDYADKALESISIAPDGELKDLLKALIKFTINREY